MTPKHQKRIKGGNTQNPEKTKNGPETLKRAKMAKIPLCQWLGAVKFGKWLQICHQKESIRKRFRKASALMDFSKELP